MGLIFWYILIGTIFNIVFDYLVNQLGEENEDLRLTNSERIVAIIVWPLVFYQFLKYFFNDNDRTED
jgi:hypothetical protein